MRYAVLASLAIATLTGCATKNFGTQVPLTEYERKNLTCREIDLEKEKVHGFTRNVDQEAKFDGRDVLAAFGDFGIGNSMAQSAAIESAQRRYYQLELAAYEKGCSTWKPEPIPDAPTYESKS